MLRVVTDRTSQDALPTLVHAGRGGWNRAQQRHVSTISHPPVHRVREIEARAAKAYIGKFSERGDLFVAAYQDRRLRVFDTTGCCRCAHAMHVLLSTCMRTLLSAGAAVYCTVPHPRDHLPVWLSTMHGTHA